MYYSGGEMDPTEVQKHDPDINSSQKQNKFGYIRKIYQCRQGPHINCPRHHTDQKFTGYQHQVK